MKPEYYSKSQYIKVYDLFSSYSLFPTSKKFLNILNYIFKEKISTHKQQEKVLITDMCAGTGYFSSLFLIENKKHWNNIKFTCCEPNKTMRETLLKKVPKYLEREVIAKTAQEYLDSLKEPQDIFIFQRCLYAFYKKDDLDKYYLFIKKLFENTKNGGHVLVFDFDSLYNIPSLENHILNNRKNIGLSEKKALQYWNILKATLEDFNNEVKNGELTLLPNSLLIDIFSKNNFSLIDKTKYFYIFQKCNN